MSCASLSGDGKNTRLRFVACSDIDAIDVDAGHDPAAAVGLGEMASVVGDGVKVIVVHVVDCALLGFGQRFYDRTFEQ